MSKATARYNCIGFAVGDERHWWEGECNGGRFRWPVGFPRKTTPRTVARIFREQGFEPTDNRDIELGFEKIAIYVCLDDLDEFSHIARSDGIVWKSKLGKGQDIHHHSLDVLEGNEIDEYGVVDIILRKAIT